MPGTDPPFPLREIADRLVDKKIAGKTDKKGFRHLLGFLKSGEIQAIAYFPDILNDSVNIPRSYWEGISIDKFDALLKKSDLNHHGVYRLKIRDVAEEIWKKITERTDGAEEKRDLLIVELIQQAHKSVDVQIRESEWRKFLVSRGIPPEEAAGKAEEERRGGGRPKKEWEKVYQELAALLWFELDSFRHKRTQEYFAQCIYENLGGSEHPDIPEFATIKREIATIRSRVKEFSERRHNSPEKKIN